MSSSNSSQIDPAISEGLSQALPLAYGSFFKGLSFVERVTTRQSTGVYADPNSGALFLFINPQTPLAFELLPVVGNWRDAWLLVLAHESGHLLLSSICQASGEDPGHPDAQLKAIGIDQNAYGPSVIADFQKETAIESFCDACAGKAAVDLLGAEWRKAVEALRDYRSRNSKSLGIFSGDEYATQPALDKLLESDGQIEPAAAARVAFEESLAKTSSLKKMAVATASLIPRLKDNLSGLRKQRRSSSAENKATRQPPAPR